MEPESTGENDHSTISSARIGQYCSGAEQSYLYSYESVNKEHKEANRSWSISLFCTGLMLLFMFLSITATEGFKDWSELTHQMYTPDCNLQPQMPIYMMSGKELFPSHEMESNLTRNQGVCNIRERYKSSWSLS